MDPKPAKKGILQDILWSPLTWGPFTIPMGVLAFTDASPLVSGLVFAVTAAIVGGGWASQLPRIRNLQAAQQIQEEHQRITNKRKSFLQALRNKDFNKFADIIEEAVAIESRISGKMQNSGNLAFTEIEETAESLLEEIIHQVRRVVELTAEYRKAPKNGRAVLKKEILEREILLEDAIQALRKTESHLANFQQGKTITSKDRLANLIDKMQEEERILTRVQERMDNAGQDYTAMKEEEW